MRLDPVDHQHVIGLVGEAVEVDGKAFSRAADDDRLHGGADRTLDELFGDPVRLDHFPLSFGRSAPVAPHRRNDERPGAKPFEMVHDRSGDQVDIGHPPTTGGDRHALARLDLLGQLQTRQLGMHFAGQVVQAGSLELLPEVKRGRIC